MLIHDSIILEEPQDVFFRVAEQLRLTDVQFAATLDPTVADKYVCVCVSVSRGKSRREGSDSVWGSCWLYTFNLPVEKVMTSYDLAWGSSSHPSPSRC